MDATRHSDNNTSHCREQKGPPQGEYRFIKGHSQSGTDRAPDENNWLSR